MSENTKELKPCPYCGGPAELYEPSGGIYKCRNRQYVPRDGIVVREKGGIITYKIPKYVPRCLDTKCPGRLYKGWPTAEGAAAAWNRRAYESKEG